MLRPVAVFHLKKQESEKCIHTPTPTPTPTPTHTHTHTCAGERGVEPFVGNNQSSDACRVTK